MKDIRIVLAEKDAILSNMLKMKIDDDELLCLAGEARDGETAWSLIESTQPDVVITELLIPKMDGLTLVEKINNSKILKKKPKVIVTSTMSSDSIVKESIKMGVSYFIVKPYNAECIISRAKNISYKIDEFSKTIIDSETIVSDYLIKFGIPGNLKGFGYLVTAITEIIQDESMMYGVTKILYPKIAKRHGSTSVRVEKGIRHAIEVAWERQSEEMRKGYYRYDVISTGKRPTNSEFIAKAVRELKSA
jgi:two-component system response regulator (stage 0 sporulation protein A)